MMIVACQPVKEQGKSDIEKDLEQIGLQNQVEEMLREIMTEAGWFVEPSEWWHFNTIPLTETDQKLTVINLK